MWVAPSEASLQGVGAAATRWSIHYPRTQALAGLVPLLELAGSLIGAASKDATVLLHGTLPSLCSEARAEQDQLAAQKRHLSKKRKLHILDATVNSKVVQRI